MNKVALAGAQGSQRSWENDIGTAIIRSSISIHREIGCGLLETAYEAVLADELQTLGYSVERQKKVDVVFRGREIDAAFRADLIVENCVILELKSLEQICDAHKKQLLTYLRLTGLRLGYLLNFGEVLMKKGITRIVNQLPE